MDSIDNRDRRTEDSRNLTRRIMQEWCFLPCALLIERSFHTQSKHDEQIVSYAYIVLRLVVTTEANCTNRVITKPFIILLEIIPRRSNNNSPSWGIKACDYSISSLVNRKASVISSFPESAICRQILSSHVSTCSSWAFSLYGHAFSWNSSEPYFAVTNSFFVFSIIL